MWSPGREGILPVSSRFQQEGEGLPKDPTDPEPATGGLLRGAPCSQPVEAGLGSGRTDWRGSSRRQPGSRQARRWEGEGLAQTDTRARGRAPPPGLPPALPGVRITVASVLPSPSCVGGAVSVA